MTRGMVLGKFLPPHAGHLYLCDFARGWASELTIVVGTLAREPIPGALRAAWMRELFPSDTVVHLSDELPEEPSQHPDFWALWTDALLRILPARPDIVFASEMYGAKLAEVLGARFVMVDLGRAIVPVSGTSVRRDPMAHWKHIPRCVRPYFAKRVSVFGPESTGKTTLAKDLALAFETSWVPEWARSVLDARGGQLEGLDWTEIVRGQIASEEALAREANRVLFCDTDPLATVVWAEALDATLPADVARAAFERRYDLTLLLAPDVEWVADPVRYLPGKGEWFFERCIAALEKAGRRYVVVRGDWAARFEAAQRAARSCLTA
jgi:HTH-type transcriptional regulator, transcriptional repressor of NAD biosynthesis genes